GVLTEEPSVATSRSPTVVAARPVEIVPDDDVTRLALWTLATVADARAATTVTRVAAAVAARRSVPAARHRRRISSVGSTERERPRSTTECTEQQRGGGDAEHQQPRDGGPRREVRDVLDDSWCGQRDLL